MTTHIFTEAIDLTEATLDTANRVLKDVVLIRAGMSKNNREYPDAVLRASAPIFEGTSAFTDHADHNQRRNGRSIREFSGVYQNVRYENGMLKADRYFAKTTAGSEMLALAEDVLAQRIPKTAVGLSINAVGKAKPREGGGQIVEAITAAESVDDVVNPAAGGSYLESGGDDLLMAVLQEMTFDEWYNVRPEFMERVKKEMKTVRQDKALTEAQALAERLTGELETAQQQIADLEAQRVADADTIAALRRELALEQVMAKVNLPSDWAKSLREELPRHDMTTWPDLIEREQKKAKAVGHRAPITGAGQQVAAPLTAPVQPRDTVAELRRRLAEARTPEELQDLMTRIARLQES